MDSEAPKKTWADEADEPESEPDLSNLSVSDGAEQDAAPPKPKSEKLNDDGQAKVAKELVEANNLYTSAKTFEELNIPEPLLRGIYSEMKFERPSKIQAETLPLILNPPHRNLVAQAHNGSGKTTCFVLGMLSRVDANLKEPQALCICPTRELAIQNQAVLSRMAKFTNITSVLAIPSASNVRSTLRGHIHDQVVLGTPGILSKWMEQKILSLRNVKILVFDEADQMLDQGGFRDFSMKTLRRLQKESRSCQILLFSATFNEKVKNFVDRTISIANRVFVERDEELSLDVIKQYRVRCPSDVAKFEVLRDRIYPIAEKLGQSIIFVDTRQNVAQLHRALVTDGHNCALITGALLPEERDKVVDEFRKGITRILISTDLIARGFDVAQVTLVVNFDLPLQGDRITPDYATYLHRIGRSGRFGRKGAAFNLLVNDNDERVLNDIEQHFGRKIPPVQWDDEEAFEQVLKEAELR